MNSTTFLEVQYGLIIERNNQAPNPNHWRNHLPHNGRPCKIIPFRFCVWEKSQMSLSQWLICIHLQHNLLIRYSKCNTYFMYTYGWVCVCVCVCVNSCVCVHLPAALRSAWLTNLCWHAQRKQIDLGKAENSQCFWFHFKHWVMEIFTPSYFLYLYKWASKLGLPILCEVQKQLWFYQ